MSHIDVNVNGQSWKMHEKYLENIDHCKKANKRDIDFKLLFSGNGMTRTGKTTLVVQTAAYLDEGYISNWRNQTCFSGDKLIEFGNKLKPGQVLVYDEARESLNTTSQLTSYCKDILNFFAECGSKNLFILIVLPEFFDLPKGITITQSLFLVNCKFRNNFSRGFADFFNHKQKKYLYIKGKKWLDYSAVKPSFQMTFTKYFPLNMQEYEKLKQSELERVREERKRGNTRSAYTKLRKHCKTLVGELIKQEEYPKARVAELLGISAQSLGQFLRYKPK